LGKLGVDAAIACCPENVYYTSGFWTKLYDQTLTELHEAFAIQTREQGEALVVSKSLRGDVNVSHPVSKVVMYYGEYPIANEPKCESHEDWIKGLTSYFESEGLEKGVLGIEKEMPWTMVNEIRKALPNAKLVQVSRSFYLELRKTKTDEEIDRIREACHITEMAFLYVLDNAKEGMYETEISDLLRQQVARIHDTETLHLDLASGPRSTWPSNASRNRLKRGDIVRLDWGVRYKHYCSDLSRNTIVGTPTEEQRRMNRVLDEAGQIVIKNMRPGVKCHDLYQMCYDDISKMYPEYWRYAMGHGIGLTVHDLPDIHPGIEDLLRPRMVLCSETAWNRYGFGTMNVEDIVLVTDNEPERLSILGRDLYTI